MFRETEPYLRLTHALWEQLMARCFCPQERRIIDLVARLSGNCGREAAYIPRQNDFEAAGVGENKIGAHLNRLISARVIFREDEGYYRLNQNFEQWQIKRIANYSPEKLAKLVSLNLKRPERRLATQGSPNLPEGEENSSLRGKPPEARSASAKERLKKGNYENCKEAGEIWGRVLGEVRKQVNAANYRTWLEGTAGLGFSKNDFVVGTREGRIADHLNP